MKKFLFCFIFLFSFLSFSTTLASTDTGIIPGSIWYSKDKLVEGDKVQIYTALWNGDTNTVLFKVEFHDGETLLGTRDVSIPSQTLSSVSVSWTVTSGDHTIYAKIISSTVGASKQNINPSNTKTEEDKQFVPIVLKTIDGKPSDTKDVLNNEINKVQDKIESVIPQSVIEPVSNKLSSLENVRDDTYKKIEETRTQTKKEIDTFQKQNKDKKTEKVVNKNPDIFESTHKPLTYIKMALFSILALVFGYKIIFYGLLILLFLFILNILYDKIRHRR